MALTTVFSVHPEKAEEKAILWDSEDDGEWPLFASLFLRAFCGCGKPTWIGCGGHIESALQGVKKDDRCPNWKKGRSYPCGEVKTPETTFGKFLYYTGLD
jgi:hypothetical protein